MGSVLNELGMVWHQFGPETKAALIGAASTFAAAGLGVGGIILQLRSQAKQAREDIAENERRAIKTKMWDEVVEDCRKFHDAKLDFTSAVRTANWQLKAVAAAKAENHPYSLPISRVMALNNLFCLASDAAIAIVSLIERRQIVDPRISIFRTGISAALHDIAEAFNNQYFPVALRSLPVDGPQNVPFPYQPPTVAEVAFLHDVAERIENSLHELLCYTLDFQREMQCLLLGDLFGTTLGYREPIDPKCVVLRLDRAEELETHFRTNTAWGRAAQRTEAEVRASFAQVRSDAHDRPGKMVETI